MPFLEAHSFGHDDAEAIEECGLLIIWLSDAAQANLTVGGSWQEDVV